MHVVATALDLGWPKMGEGTALCGSKDQYRQKNSA